jgi:hypothetical protein
METESVKSTKLDMIDYVRRERLALLKVTEMERKFCEQYVLHFNGLLAMQEAGYKLSGYVHGSKEKQDARNAERLLKEVLSRKHVQAYILLLKENVASRLGVSLDMIVEEYRRMAFASMSDYISWNSDGITFLRDSEDLTEAQRAGVMEITETETKWGKTVKIKLFSKQPALDRLLEILEDLEAHQETRKPAATVSPKQINIILQNPVARTAIEHLSSLLFDKQILITANDKDRLEFDKNVKIMTQKFLEATHADNVGGQADVPIKKITTGGDGERKDLINYIRPQEEKNKIADERGFHKEGKSGTPLNGNAGEAGDVAEPDRYGVDGL